MMIPKVHSDNNNVNSESSNSIPQFQYQTVGKVYTGGSVGITLLNDRKSYLNDVNNFEMDNIFRNRHDNVSILQSDPLRNDKSGDEDDLVSWDSTAVDENWWSICQLPVFVVLVTVIAVLAITFVILLWLKSQMIQSEKNKKVVILDGSQIQLSNNGGCPCPSSNAPSEERWICHTVINLKDSSGEGGAEAVEVQPQEATKSVPEILGKRVEEVEKRPGGLKMKAKGLLERRGSSASLTIDLPQAVCDSKSHVVTPTQECSSEEFLMSAGNVMSREQLKNCLNDIQRLHQEFWQIPLNHPEKSVVTGSGTKNRYQSILPNEKTRVKLIENEDESLDSYINANYIRGYDGEEKAYIATQGPLPNTIQDLYTMAWNENSSTIAMITKFFEKTKVKCESYFPEEVNKMEIYGDFQVTVISLQKKEGFSVRELLVQNNSEVRRILHYWYDSWPDHQTPQNAHSIVEMATEIERCRNSHKTKSASDKKSKTEGCGPVIVHCSAGIGRTGCFIAISMAISQLLEEDKVDILGIVCQMRCDRGGMIQTAEQYEFVHKAVALFAQTLPEVVEE